MCQTLPADIQLQGWHKERRKPVLFSGEEKSHEILKAGHRVLTNHKLVCRGTKWILRDFSDTVASGSSSHLLSWLACSVSRPGSLFSPVGQTSWSIPQKKLMLLPSPGPYISFSSLEASSPSPLFLKILSCLWVHFLHDLFSDYSQSTTTISTAPLGPRISSTDLITHSQVTIFMSFIIISDLLICFSPH